MVMGLMGIGVGDRFYTCFCMLFYRFVLFKVLLTLVYGFVFFVWFFFYYYYHGYGTGIVLFNRVGGRSRCLLGSSTFTIRGDKVDNRFLFIISLYEEMEAEKGWWID